MKGIVFRAFESFVEARFPNGLADDMLTLETLESGGAYTTVGYYPHTEFLAIAIHVAETTKTPINQLVKDFGQALFYDLAGAHPDMIKTYNSPIGLLAVIESVIHRDVRKLYTSTELPRFDVTERDGDRGLTMKYSSSRPFADLAEGLIWGCLDFYRVKEISSVIRHDVASDGTHSVFKVETQNELKPSTLRH